MKIALAHKRLDLAGGTERDFYRTAEGLRDLGHEVHLFCAEFEISPPQGTGTHKVPILALGRTARLLSFAFLAPKVILPHQCDVVVSFGRIAQQDVLRSGGGTHRVFLKKMESGEGLHRRLWHLLSPYHRSVLAIERLQYRPGGYKRVVAVSQEVKREIVTTYEVPEEKVTVIYNGVDHERFHPRIRRQAGERIRRQWGIPEQSPLVLFVGSGFQRKGLERLLRVWGSARLEGVYLLVVGDDAQRGRYAAWAEREAAGRIIFAGRQGDIENYYAAADLLALPALQEAFGNVVLEALASGLPVLLARAVGAAEILTAEMEENIVAQPDDPSEMEAKILCLLDRARWPQLSAQARRLGERYSWQNHFRELEQLLAQVAEQKRCGTFA
ncbi:MAG: glycosyltransferase family 4 protein [Deltaproteobacteria bacterium]|nr:glycosyltransferase family 4 protein [Deltaproteobacteria bacterium]